VTSRYIINQRQYPVASFLKEEFGVGKVLRRVVVPCQNSQILAIKKEAEVTFIDYGNQDTVSFANIRPLDPRFRSLPGQPTMHDLGAFVCFDISVTTYVSKVL